MPARIPLACLFLAAGLGCAPERPIEPVPQASHAVPSKPGDIKMGPDAFVRHWVERVEAVPPGSFRHAADPTTLPPLVWGDSLSWCETLFIPAANPHRAENQARVDTYVAPPGVPWATEDNKARSPAYATGAVWLDLLRFTYTLGGRPLVVYESINFVLARVTPAKAPPDSGSWARAVDQAAHEILNMSGTARLDLQAYPYTWAFQFPPHIGEGTVISTNPDVSPDSLRWTDRADALVHGGSIWLMAYKRRPPAMGFAPDGRWFDDAFRRAQAP
jgi:hypothetical protein